ncbi:MAG: GNAT family N-acetyltransferase [Clostridia bacterium]|nr:GNAT family N-acetyltransferase [Clostridia bacterium]
MIFVRQLPPDDLPSSLNADKSLIGEQLMIRITRLGFSLQYVPRQTAVWGNYPMSRRAENALSLTSSALFGAFEGDEIIGQAIVTEKDGFWADILDLRVDVSHRRIGAGRLLLDACQTWGLTHACRGLSVTATDDNPVLCQFLEHQAFHLEGMDRFALALTDSERDKPLAQRKCQLFFYRPFQDDSI